MDVEKVNIPKREVERSPRSPSISIEEAYEKAEALYRQERRNPTTAEIAVKHMGWGLNGNSRAALGALKQYGFIEGDYESIRVTDQAKYVFVHPAGDPERIAALREMALRPAMFRMVLDKYGRDLPSDATLIAKAQTEWGFVSEAAATRFVRVLRESIRYADSLTTQSDGPPDPSDPDAVPSVHATTSAVGAPQAAQTAPAARVATATRPAPGVAAESLQMSWYLGQNVTASVILDRPPSAQQALLLKRYLELFVEALSLDRLAGEEHP